MTETRQLPAPDAIGPRARAFPRRDLFSLFLIPLLPAVSARAWAWGPPYRTRAPMPAGIPQTIDDALDAAARLMSPEALGMLLATPEADMVVWHVGFRRLINARWGFLDDDPLQALGTEMAAAGVPDRLRAAFLLTSLARRQKGQALDVDAQLAPFIEEERRREEADARLLRDKGIIVRCRTPLEILDVIPFRTNDAAVPSSQSALLDAVAATVKANYQITLVEIQGHAASHERNGRALSLERARAVVTSLLARQVDPRILTAYGLGAAYHAPRDAWRAPPTDQRAEFLILRHGGPLPPP